MDPHLSTLLDSMEHLSTSGSPALPELEADPGPGPARRGVTANAGTSTVSVLTGQAQTVFSLEESPAYHSTMQDQEPIRPSVAVAPRKFKIFCMPENAAERDRLCGGLIGQGGTFCTRRDCLRVHQGGRSIEKLGKMIYVAKTTTQAWTLPSVDGNVISEELLEEWMNTANTFDVWNQQFLVVTSLDKPQEKPATREDFDDGAEFATRALAFKTPAKRSRDQMEVEPIAIQFAPYVSQMNSPTEEGTSEPQPEIDLQQLAKIIKGVDEALVATDASIRTLAQEYQNFLTAQSEVSATLNFKVDAQTSQIGAKPGVFSEAFDTPTMWGTIAAVAGSVTSLQEENKKLLETRLEVNRLDEEVEKIGNQHSSFKAALSRTHEELIHSLAIQKEEDAHNLNKTVETILGTMQRMNVKIAGLNSKLETGSRQAPMPFIDVDSILPDSDLPASKRNRMTDNCEPLRRRLQEVESELTTRFTAMESELTTRFHEVNSGMGAMETEIHQLTERPIGVDASLVDALMGRVSTLEAASEEKNVSFANLGFGNMPDCVAWLEANNPAIDVSMVYDAHMVFEQMYRDHQQTDTLKRMESMAKTKTKTLADATAIASFDARTPKIFASTDNPGVVTNEQSFFDQVKSYADWSYSGTGAKACILNDLAEFHSSRSEMLSNTWGMDPSSKMYFVASQALTLSVAWVQAFVTFIEEYYTDLSQSKFGSNKAWHVTTRIARKILLDVSYPRKSAKQRFSVDEPRETALHIFWSVIHSHDKMAEFRKLGFKNHPAVATELVKFLAVNTGFEVVEKLQSHMTKTLEDVKELQRIGAQANKSASTAGNKAEDVRKELAETKKALAALQKKVDAIK